MHLILLRRVPLKIAGVVLAVAALAGLVWAFLQWRDVSLLTVEQIGVLVVGAVVTAMFGKWVMKIVRFRETITKILIGIGMSALGFLLARVHLHVFDKIFLWLGRLERLKRS